MSMSSDKAMKGGAGAADYGVAIYGDAGSQHAGASGSIAMNSPSAYGAAPMSGGRRRKRRSSRKGRKSSRRRGSSKSRRSRR